MLESMPKTNDRVIECSIDSGANGDGPRIAPPPPGQDLFGRGGGGGGGGRCWH